MIFAGAYKGMKGVNMSEDARSWSKSILLIVIFAALTLAFLFYLSAPARGDWEVEITSHSTSQQVTGSVLIEGDVTSNVTDTGDIEEVKFDIDAGPEMVCNNPNGDWSTWNFTWDSFTAADGNHDVTVHLYITEANSTSKVDTDTVTLDVLNPRPEANLVSVSETNAVEGTKIHFRGNGTNGTIVEYTWTSSIDGNFGPDNMTKFHYSGLSPGTHTISFKVKASNGKDSHSKNTTVTITSTPEWPFYRQGLTRAGEGNSGPYANSTAWIFETDSPNDLFSGAPIIADGKVFIGLKGQYTQSIHGNNARYGALYCFDLEGTSDQTQGTAFGRSDLLWKVKLDKQVLGAPAYSDGVVFIGTEYAAGNNTFAFDADTGDPVKVWDVGEGKNVSWAYEFNGGVHSGPVVVGDMLIISAGQKVAAINITTAQKVWSTGFGDLVLGSPTVAAGRVYIASTDGELYALDLDTGAILASTDLGDNHDTTAVFYDKRVYYAAHGDTGMDDKLVARTFDNLGDGVTGTWDFQSDGRIETSPALADDRIYFTTDAGTLYCLDIDGNKKWEKDIGMTVSGSPVVAGNLLYLGGEDGDIVCYNLTGVTSPAKEWELFTNMTTESSPALLDGILVIGSGYKVYAISGVKSLPIAEILGVTITDPTVVPDTYDPYMTVSRDISLTFNGTGSDEDGYPITGYNWSSDLDGDLGSGADLVLDKGLTAGLHTISLKVKNSLDMWSPFTTFMINVTNNSAPVANVDYSGDTWIDGFVTISADGSTDPDGSDEIVKYQYIIDGDVVRNWTTSSSIFYQFKSAKQFIIEVKVKDKHGMVSDNIATKTIDISKTKPGGNGGTGNGGDDDDLFGRSAVLLGGTVIVIIILIVIMFLVMGSRRSGEKKEETEFIEEDMEDEEDLKEKKVEAIASTLGADEVLKAHEGEKPKGAKKGKKPPAKEPEPEAEKEAEREPEKEKPEAEPKEEPPEFKEDEPVSTPPEPEEDASGSSKSLDDLAKELETLKTDLETEE